MGTWGTKINENDTFADVYSEFYELYNNGKKPSHISEQLIKDNWEMLEIKEDRHDFWFAIAQAQWETKALDPKVLQTVEEIVESGADLKLWEELEADKADITKRKQVLEKFLQKLHSERSRAKARRKPKVKEPIFAKGDCLTFKLSNGKFGGAVVLADDEDPETAYNLVATTRINQNTPPTLIDFEKSEVLVMNFAAWKDKTDINWYLPDMYHKEYSGIYTKVGSIKVEMVYRKSNYMGEGYPFKPAWTGSWTMNENVDRQFESEISKAKPSKSLTIKQLTRKKRWWNIF